MVCSFATVDGIGFASARGAEREVVTQVDTLLHESATYFSLSETACYFSVDLKNTENIEFAKNFSKISRK
jgi:hypothetical protein